MQIDFDRFEGCNQSKIKIIHSSSPVLTTAQRQYSDGKMVYTDVNGPMIKEPYNEIKKDKKGNTSSGYQQQQNQQPSSRKDNKHGAWGPIFKNKENFINMHIG